jgi:hypothetical protein
MIDSLLEFVLQYKDRCAFDTCRCADDASLLLFCGSGVMLLPCLLHHSLDCAGLVLTTLPPTACNACPRHCRCRMELIKPAVDWRKAGVKVNTMGAAVAAKQ